jgi:TRAP-type uncharacterized transport system fused permease subunit
MILTSLVPAILLFLAAVGQWQYGLASEFRWVVGACTLLLILTALRRDSFGWLVVLLITFVLYNPLVPIRLSVDTLEILDLLACAFVLTAGIDFSS